MNASSWIPPPTVPAYTPVLRVWLLGPLVAERVNHKLSQIQYKLRWPPSTRREDEERRGGMGRFVARFLCDIAPLHFKKKNATTNQSSLCKTTTKNVTRKDLTSCYNHGGKTNNALLATAK